MLNVYEICYEALSVGIQTMSLGTYEVLSIGIKVASQGTHKILDAESNYIAWYVRSLGCRFSDYAT